MAQKVLIVEDDAILRDILATKLTTQGFSVLTSPDGEAALETIKKESPDIVLLDILIPKKTGFEVLEAMRTEGLLEKTKVIAVSNSGDPREVKQATELGASDFLVKAIFDSNDVIARVKQVLSGGEALPHKDDSSTKTNEPTTNTMNETPVSGKGTIVLITEDDKFLREIASQKLEKEGFTVMAAGSGKEAIEAIEKQIPDILILDLILPGMDGFEVLAKIKEKPEWSKLPVIVLSNLGQEAEIKKAKDLGAHDYLIKAHFSFGEIIKKIHEVLGK